MLDHDNAILNPPHTNRGGTRTKAIEMSLDWLSGTFGIGCLDSIKQVIEDALSGYLLADKGIGFRGFEHVIAWEVGLTLSWSANFSYGYLNLTGDCCDILGTESVIDLIKVLLPLGFKPTRIDVAMDDYHKRVPPGLVYQWAKGGFMRGKKVFAFTESHKDSVVGSTFYAGVRGKNGGLSYVRYYDKSVHHDDPEDCYRLEVEFRSEKAQDLALKISIHDPETGPIQDMLQSCLKPEITFVTTSNKDIQLCRCQIQPMWNELFVGVPPLKIRGRKRNPNLEKSIEALTIQWGGLFASLKDYQNDAAEAVLKHVLRRTFTKRADLEKQNRTQYPPKAFKSALDGGQLAAYLEKLRIEALNWMPSFA